MANDLTRNPWVLDTGDPAVVVHANTTFIQALVWQGYGNASDQMIIRNGVGGSVAYNWRGNADLSPVQLCIGNNARIRDMVLDTLTSGTVTVNVE